MLVRREHDHQLASRPRNVQRLHLAPVLQCRCHGNVVLERERVAAGLRVELQELDVDAVRCRDDGDMPVAVHVRVVVGKTGRRQRVGRRGRGEGDLSWSAN